MPHVRAPHSSPGPSLRGPYQAVAEPQRRLPGRQRWTAAARAATQSAHGSPADAPRRPRAGRLRARRRRGERRGEPARRWRGPAGGRRARGVPRAEPHGLRHGPGARRRLARARRRGASGARRRHGRDGCVVGFAEAGRVHIYNSAAYLQDGSVRHVHRKLFLPTRHLGGAQALHARGRDAGVRHALGLRRRPDLRRRLAARARLGGRPGRGARAHRARREHGEGARDPRRLARPLPLLRAHARVLRRVREPRRRGARTRLLGRLADLRPLRGARRRGADERAGARVRRARPDRGTPAAAGDAPGQGGAAGDAAAGARPARRRGGDL